MIKKHYIYNFFLHYGISTVLVIMFFAIVYMLQVIEISNKVNVDIYINTDKEYYAYLPKNSIQLNVNSLLHISVQNDVELVFEVVNIKTETSYIVCQLKPVTNKEVLHQTFSGNSKLTGYAFSNKVKLVNLIFNKWVIKF